MIRVGLLMMWVLADSHKECVLVLCKGAPACQVVIKQSTFGGRILQFRQAFGGESHGLITWCASCASKQTQSKKVCGVRQAS